MSYLGLKQLNDLTAKAVIGDYVYTGSVNLGYSLLHENRELGIIIKPQIAAELKSLIATRSGQVQGSIEWSGSFILSGYTIANNCVGPDSVALLLRRRVQTSVRPQCF